MQLSEKCLTRLLNFYLTKAETESVKKLIFVTFEVFAVMVTLVGLIYAFWRPAFWPTLPIFAVAVYVTHRVYRRSSRRCPKCSGQDNNKKSGVRHRLRKIFGGWFVRRNYWRELPPKVERTEDINLLKCFFHHTCLVCRYDYEVKPPVLKSFGSRPPLIRNW